VVFSGKELDFVTVFPAHQIFGDKGDVELTSVRVPGQYEIVLIKDIGIFINPQRGMNEEDIIISFAVLTQTFCVSEKIMGFQSRDTEFISLDVDDR